MPRKTATARVPELIRLAGFNEAAARCRGKPISAGRRDRARLCFNEAAARCRGKPLRVAVDAADLAALQ